MEVHGQDIPCDTASVTVAAQRSRDDACCAGSYRDIANAQSCKEGRKGGGGTCGTARGCPSLTSLILISIVRLPYA